MADQARVPDQGALHSELLPAPRSDRAVMGADASPRDPQPKPPELQRLLPIRSAFPARGGAEKLGRLLRFGYRQFPRHQPCRFSGSQGVGVYIPLLFEAKSIGLSNALILSLMITSSQIPGKLLNGVLSDFLGRKLTYALFALVALVGAYFFGQSSDPIVMMGWGCLFLFAASGSAPSYKMWYAEQYPTPIRAIGQSTCEGIGGKLFGGVVWTAVFPVLVEAFGIGTTMTLIAVIGLVTLLVVVAFAPETAGRSVEELEGQARRGPPNGLMNPMDASSRL